MTQRGSGSAASPGIMHSCVCAQFTVLAEALAVIVADEGALASVGAKVISPLLCPTLQVKGGMIKSNLDLIMPPLTL